MYFSAISSRAAVRSVLKKRSATTRLASSPPFSKRSWSVSSKVEEAASSGEQAVKVPAASNTASSRAPAFFHLCFTGFAFLSLWTVLLL